LAIKEGYGKVHREAEGKIVLIEREEAVRLWRKKNTDIGISFPVNSPISTFLLATAKHEGKFIVDAISTDGGGIPRNVIVKKGLLLVKYGALSLTDFVRKTSMAPAKMFNLDQKGHLGAGADADITVLDVDKEKATMAINRGKPIMVDGFVVGKGANIIRN
jgi:predicted amidohydrolase